ncbi:MAG: YgiQ family radical SAM protein [Gammaproteobacteria bacterium]|nr:YgiQ family radical SAM protein [Gammaproteobacteria bacterium]
MTTKAPTQLNAYPKYWAECYGNATFLPTSRQEMDELGWDSCDVIIVTGDAYIDHPSFGMAIMGRTLEAQGFRVGIISQPDWQSKNSFQVLGKPNLYFGITAGNMDSMINRYTADRRIRHDDAYSPSGEAGKRPDRAVTVYSQRCREAYKGVPIIIGGIESSLRRIAHYDYWSDKVRPSVLINSKADLLIYGSGERSIIEVTHRLARGEHISSINDIRGTAIMLNTLPDKWQGIDSTRVDLPGKTAPDINPYDVPETHQKNPLECDKKNDQDTANDATPLRVIGSRKPGKDSRHTYIRLPSYEKVINDKILYAHASRVLHQETNPYNARTLVQKHGKRDVWINPPPIPLSTEELDSVFEFPYQRIPHPQYGNANIPAYEMIRFSINIMRGCFGGCTFCSITEHEGRIIQSRSEKSILKEVEAVRDKTPGFTGTISDLGGPTANMYRLNCNDDAIQEMCRRPSCVFPKICDNLITDHSHTTRLYRQARQIPGIKRILVASGLRYDLAVRDPEYVKELVTHHVGGYLKIAPEHTEAAPLSKMMKPGVDTYYSFKKMFDHYSKEAGKKQYLIPYFIAAHPGTGDEDMMNLGLWLKKEGFRVDQVQNFFPSPMALATTMYHSEKNPLRKVNYKSERVLTPRKGQQRKIHKAFLRNHDPENWPLLRQALKDMGRSDLIGPGKDKLVPADTENPRHATPKHGQTQNKTFVKKRGETSYSGDSKKSNGRKARKPVKRR